MVDEKPRSWPDWDKPASKGEVISAMVAVQSCIIDVLIALSASRRGDEGRVSEAIQSLYQNNEELEELIDTIGGASDG